MGGEDWVIFRNRCFPEIERRWTGQRVWVVVLGRNLVLGRGLGLPGQSKLYHVRSESCDCEPE